ncbi:endoribonuclease ysh1 [Maudiozyma exigua]|uniref:Endoribonuclease ysh1 n=1 Tax=Maudiozyma exigua TaxID=34358 RepID=A0A9P6WAK2_MAUEX|nr:endoribonuclease ysh1 [Kazachstania exigua]
MSLHTIYIPNNLELSSVYEQLNSILFKSPTDNQDIILNALKLMGENIIQLTYMNSIIELTFINKDNSNNTRVDIDILDKDNNRITNKDQLELYNILLDTIILVLFNCNNNNNKQTILEEPASSILLICSLLKEQFGDTFTTNETTYQGIVQTEKYKATIDLHKMNVIESDSIPLKGRIESVLVMGRLICTPLC